MAVAVAVADGGGWRWCTYRRNEAGREVKSKHRKHAIEMQKIRVKLFKLFKQSSPRAERF